MKELSLLVLLLLLGGSVVFYFEKKQSKDSSDLYKECADEGGETLESNPPTCLCPDRRGSVTPSRYFKILKVLN